MDRIINVKVGGNHLSKDSKNAGVRGEANVTNLRITFDEGWDGYAKTVVFYDAHGNNPVKRIQGVDLLEDIKTGTRTYITSIPQKPLAIEGDMTFVIEGYKDGKKQKSIADKLVVKYSPDTDNAEEPTDPTPTQAEQLQSQIDGIIETIQNATISEENAKKSENNAKNSEFRAANFLIKCEDAANQAKESATKATKAIGKTSYIGNNGNWYAWDSVGTNAFYDTGVRAQAGSEVYVGVNPPDTADVIIDPNGESALYAPYVGGNGNWYTFNPETQTFTDSGKRAKGDKGDKGDTYTLTDEDKTDIGNDVSAEIEAELNEALDEIIAIQEELMTPDGNGVAY